MRDKNRENTQNSRENSDYKKPRKNEEKKEN